MADLVHITDHAAQALARLDRALRDRPKREAAIGALVGQVQELEDAFQALATQRTIDGNTVGAQLDNLGRIVGEARNGLGDGDYLVLILARIRRNRSSGNAEEILALFRPLVSVLAGLTARMRWTSEYPAGFALALDGPIPGATGELLARILTAAEVAGVRGLLAYSAVVPADTFTWDGTSAQAWDVGLWATSIEG